ncbi:MAG TPA: nuclease-related domain-containing protein [Syntrophorhabdales bacterium]|nr:nuclease-related domain-containing protein [Syntrophorhabdales bacterium]
MKVFLFLLLALLIVAGKVYLKAALPRLKGFIGEKKTGIALEGLPDDHVVMHDLLFQNEGRTSQVDHVVISRHGVFVIETKAYDGWIYGSERSEYWTQVLGNKKTKFYNPVRQNRAHVQALRNTLARYGDLPYWSVVVFGDLCEFKKVDTTTPVIHRRELVDYLLNCNKDDVLTQGDIRDICQHLVSANIQSKEARKQHVRYAKTRKELLEKRLASALK